MNIKNSPTIHVFDSSPNNSDDLLDRINDPRIEFVLFGIKDAIPNNLSLQKVSQLKSSDNSRIFEIIEDKKINIETSYTYILDSTANRIGILKLEFNQDNTVQELSLIHI